MISLPDRLLYLHPSKTAGTSVEQAILRHHLGDGTIPGLANQLFFVYNGNSNQHFPLDKMLNLFPFLGDWRRIVTVRHPYTRVISEFRYQRNGNKYNGRPGPLYKKGDINTLIKNGGLWKNAFAWHGMPQVKYFDEETEILRFESLEQDWEDAMGRDYTPLPHVLQGHRDPVDELTDESKEAIYEKFKEDFEVLGYEP